MKAGEFAPNFILKDDNGNEFELYKNLEKNLLLVFYPKDDTPVCSAQLSDYNNNLNDFERNGIRIIGVGTDSVESHSAFCKKLNLNFHLLADVEKKVSKQFEAINFLGMNKRLLVLIGTDKKIIWTDATIPVKYINAREILKKAGLLKLKEMT